jgi:LysM repeat protein
VVQPGEVVARIAQRYNISVQELLSFNPGVNPRRLHAGQRLVVQGADTARHRIRPGEVLSLIASRYGVTIEDLVRWNRGLNPDRIRVGSTIIVQNPE